MNNATKQLEAKLLGRLLSDREAIAELGAYLNPHHFTFPVHREIAEAIWLLFDTGKPIDILTVKNQMQYSSTSHPFELLDPLLKSLIADTSFRISADAHVLIQEAIKRDVVHLAANVAAMAYEETANSQKVIDFYEEGLIKIVEDNIHKDSLLITKILDQAISHLKTKTELMPTGVQQIDDIISGMLPGEFIVLGARPSTGKSAFALHIASRLAASIRRAPVAIFSLEMPAVQLVNRMLSAETGIELTKFKTGNLQNSDWHKLVFSNLAAAPIYIDDSPALTVFEIRSRCRRMVAEHGVQLIIIDYLQLINSVQGKNQTREQAVSLISRMLKYTALTLKVPVMALSQLGRAVEERSDKRPKMFDLRESGSLEQDADMVWLLYCAEQYGIEFDDFGNSTKGVIECGIEKNRNGKTGVASMNFRRETMRFS